jgi:hypothetical protein
MDEDYDLFEVPVKEQEEAKKWFHAVKPSSSRHYGGGETPFQEGFTAWNHFFASSCDL